MLTLGPIAFAAPWALLALAGLPVLWWLLRVTPPAPRLLRFPAIRLLFGLRQDEQTPARTPLWLILLRMVLATLIILGLAQPLLNPSTQLRASGQLVLVVDDGWAAARGWEKRIAALDGLLERAKRTGRSVIVATTARPEDAAPVAPSGLLTPEAARSRLQALKPKPWGTSRARALAALKKAAIAKPANVVWLSDGIDTGDTEAFVAGLQSLGEVEVMLDDPDNRALAMPPPDTHAARLSVKVLRPGGGPRAYWVRGLDENGRLLVRERVAFADGATSAAVALPLPAELRNRLTRLEIENVPGAGAVALLDERWRRRPVGLLTTTANRIQDQPLLSEVYYLERAIGPYVELRKGDAATLLARRLALLIVPDGAVLTDTTRGAIKSWMQRGGTVLRFAGPRLGQRPDDLTPVPLRAGDRALGGAMSWTEPARLRPFEDSSPFAGLPIPKDVLVRRQVLAQPSLELASRTWARLVDGTPLVTAARRGRGRIVLVHTSANTDWSNLAISGLFVEMLRRIVAISEGVSGARTTALPPLLLLDGFGRFTEPGAAAQPLPPEATDPTPAAAPAPTAKAEAKAGAKGTAAAPQPRVGPHRPPGYYGNESARYALNLADGMTRLAPLPDLPAGVRTLALAAPEEFDFKPWLLAAALAVLLADLWIGLALRGLGPPFWPFSRLAGASGAALFLAAAIGGSVALTSTPSLAQGAPSPADARAMLATFDTHLAYVRTGDPRTDETSLQGLRGLSEILRQRTSVEPKAPLAVDIEHDELSFFPLIYWPITPTQPIPSPKARDKLARYLRTGGMILFDTRDQGDTSIGDPTGVAPPGPGAARLRLILRGLQVPALTPVPKNHILTKAFYLLKDFPGRWAGGTLWVERATGSANDGVSSVVIGSNDYAAAWAIDSQGQPIYPVMPGGARQREMARRFGVNLVMYALTGNYKSDQVHVPAILERLGQ